MRRLRLFLPLLILIAAQSAPADSDPYLWLEDVSGDRALTWVRERNAQTTGELERDPNFAALYARLLTINESRERIPYVTSIGGLLYNFWRDAAHVRGIWRRTSFEEYRKTEPTWEPVLDLDALAAEEKENWLWAGADCVRPQNDRCLISLSRGGGDAHVIREFDLPTKRFVPEGFVLPEAKSSVTWRSRDELYVGTDFGRSTLTASGYPRLVKRWRRNTPLNRAKTVFRGKQDDVAISTTVVEEPGFHREIIERSISYFSTEYWLIEGRLRRLNVPLDAELISFHEHLLVKLRTDWRVAGSTYPGGALLAIRWNDFLANRQNFTALYTPTSSSSLGRLRATRNYLLIGELDNIQGKIHALSFRDNTWYRDTLPLPSLGTIGASPVDAFTSDDYFLTVTDFVTPPSLYLGAVGDGEHALLKQLPAFFDAAGLAVSQFFATSKDGTRVPYFVVAKRNLESTGANPTLLYGYGGFEISTQPAYNPTIGSAWLERGGVYVLANIRGGGEFGPRWHQAAVRENRQRAFDDFIAVAEDLVARKITTPKRLGIMGASNGGLLMGVMLTQRPDLFGAVVCQVPLLDMRRYHKLLAGASWQDEYGNPDNAADWAYLKEYSPYQNVRPGTHYPPVLFTTSTRDDRVHPAHARKMAALMSDLGQPVLYYENIDGGHSGVANTKQQTYLSTLAFTFLWKQLGGVTAP